jgi:hypothetical protein
MIKLTTDTKIAIQLDADSILPRLYSYYEIEQVDEDSFEELQLKIKDIISNKKTALPLFANIFEVEVEYGYVLCMHMFPDLFNNKRYITKIRKNLRK